MEMDFNKNFSENLKMLRKFRGLTQVEVSEKLGIDSQNYFRWESGKNIPNSDTIEELSKILQKHRSFFFAG
jgi:transcriptional regulator with XRE-family HTH domain